MAIGTDSMEAVQSSDVEDASRAVKWLKEKAAIGVIMIFLGRDH